MLFEQRGLPANIEQISSAAAAGGRKAVMKRQVNKQAQNGFAQRLFVSGANEKRCLICGYGFIYSRS